MKKIILAQPLINIKDSSKIIKSVLKSNFIMKEIKPENSKKKSANY